MRIDAEQPRLGHRGSVSSRARDIVLRTLATLVGAVALAGAFVLSLAFFAVALSVILIFGAYLWWKTRELRRQMRDQVQERMAPQRAQGDVIEGVVLSRGEDERRPR